MESKQRYVIGLEKLAFAASAVRNEFLTVYVQPFCTASSLKQFADWKSFN